MELVEIFVGPGKAGGTLFGENGIIERIRRETRKEFRVMWLGGETAVIYGHTLSVSDMFWICGQGFEAKITAMCIDCGAMPEDPHGCPRCANAVRMVQEAKAQLAEEHLINAVAS